MQRLELMSVTPDAPLVLDTGVVTAVDEAEGTVDVTDSSGDLREGLSWLLPVAVDDEVYIIEQGNIELVLGSPGEALDIPPLGTDGQVLTIRGGALVWE